jgi:hypothetical protein
MDPSHAFSEPAETPIVEAAQRVIEGVIILLEEFFEPVRMLAEFEL